MLALPCFFHQVFHHKFSHRRPADIAVADKQNFDHRSLIPFTNSYKPVHIFYVSFGFFDCTIRWLSLTEKDEKKCLFRKGGHFYHAFFFVHKDSLLRQGKSVGGCLWQAKSIHY